MGNANCLCDNTKDLIISNDLRIDDIMKHLMITRQTITEIDSQIRKILTSKASSRMDLLNDFLEGICNMESMGEYASYFIKWVKNVVGFQFQFRTLLGLIILPLVNNFENRDKKAVILSNYIFDFIGKSRSSMYITVRYIIEINTDHIYFVLKRMLQISDNSTYLKIWSISRKERFMSKILLEFKSLFNHNYEELRKICNFDKIECEAVSSQNEDLAVKQSIAQFIDTKMSCLEGSDIRNCLIRDYFEEIGI